MNSITAGTVGLLLGVISSFVIAKVNGNAAAATASQCPSIEQQKVRAECSVGTKANAMPHERPRRPADNDNIDAMADAPESASSLSKRVEGDVTVFREIEALTRTDEQAQAATKRTEQEIRNNRAYDLSDKQLDEMAARCELRWDMPSLGTNPPTVTDRSIQALGLNEDEEIIINKILASAHKEIHALVRQSFADLLADPATEGVSSAAMFEEILDKSNRAELKTIFQRLAVDRAHRLPPPSDLTVVTPLERMLRTMTSAGDILEARLADKLGPTRAREFRDLNNGWDSQHRSSFGCP